MEKLILKLRKKNIEIKIADNKLKINVPKTFSDENLIEEIRENKEALIEYIKHINKATKLETNIPKIDNIGKKFKLTSAQMRMFISDDLTGDSLVYNLPQAYEIDGEVHKEKLAEVFEKLIKRHESLRTCFMIDKNHEPCQVTMDEVVFEIEHFKVSNSEVHSVMRRFFRRFDLNQAPLIRVGLIEINKTSFILLVDLHHIISDGTSQEILMHNFVKLYNDESLPEVKVRYRDYLKWYLAENHQKEISSQKDFWLREFSSNIPELNIPTDYPRPEKKSYKGGTYHFKISKEERNALNSITIKYNVSLFSVLLSAYSILFSKLSNQEDIVIGTPSAGRGHIDLQDMIGVFVNTLPLRLYPEKNMIFSEFLQKVSKQTLKCFDNQEYPYEKLVEDIGISRDPAYNPIFDTLFVMQNMQRREESIRGLKIKSYEHNNHDTSKVDITLFAFESEEGIQFKMEYALDLFKEKTIEVFAEYFKRIIKQITTNNKVLLTQISLLADDEKSDLLNFGINEKNENNDSRLTIIELFEKQANKTPNNIAIELENESITYKELDDHSNQMAHKLKALGAKRNKLIGILMEKNIDTIVCLLGVIKSGAAYLPIDVNYPKERIQYIMKDSEIEVLLTTKKWANFLKTTKSIITLEEFKKEEWTTDKLPFENHGNDLCYVIYTSGSTGKPKGVMIKHNSLINYIKWATEHYVEGNPVCFPLYTSFSFDLTVTSIFIPLITGGKVIIYEKNEEITIIESILIDNKVDVIKLTPSHLKIINLSDKLSEVFDKSNLRKIIVGGEELTFKLAKQISDKFKGRIDIYNEYGPTEATIGCMIYKFEQESNAVSVPIGKPIINTNIYVLDTELNLVPEGVIGELYIAGEGLALGYLNNEQLTKDKFVENPFFKGQRMYKSGDLALWLRDGNLVFKGRSDDQVKIRGFRIELSEIEYHILNIQLIDQVVLIARNEEFSDTKYLSAYFVAKTRINEEEIINYLKEKIPVYMIPSYFVQVDEIPLTSNNKVDTGKLPSLQNKSKNNYTPARNYHEEAIINIWSEVLSIPKIGIKDNFFELGGDSIRAIGIISKINKKFKSFLSIADLHSNQTVEELGIFLNKKEDEKRAKLVSAAELELRNFEEQYKKKNSFLDNYEAVYPMNGVEKGMVFYSMKDVDKHVYHIQKIYPIPEKNFDLEVFRKTLEHLIEKHDTLRKVFDLNNFAHIILRTTSPKFSYLDISEKNLSESEKFEIVQDKIFEERYREINLSKSILWRILIIKLSENHHLLMLNSHHSLFDGWSLSSFVSELYNVYYSLVGNKSYVPVKLQSSYKDHILEELSATNNQASSAYWKQELTGYQRLEFPKTGLEHEYKMNQFNLGSETRKSLEGIAASYGTTFKHLTFAAYLYTMRMLTYNNDITVGIVTNNRPLTIDGDQLLGCFVNTVPFRVQIPSDCSWADYIRLVESKLRELKYHEKMPFYKVLETIEESSQENNPIFDTSFNFTDFRALEGLINEDQEELLDKQNISFESFMNNNTLFDFNVNAENKGFMLTICYSSTVLDEVLSERLFNYYKNILEQFIHNGEEKLDKNSILTNKEKKYLLEVNDYLDKKIQYPSDKTIIDIFENQVSLTPDNVALVFENKSLTYKELNNLSNKIAHILKKEEIQVGGKVGIFMDKTHHTIACMLGILKVGGCYLPIDITYPAERINYILEDSELRVLIAKEEYTKLVEDKCNVIKWNQIEEIEETFSNPKKANSPDDLCYVLYTSGTTGNPKGVMLEHKNVIRLLFNSELQFKFSDKDVWTMFHSHCFDFSVWEIYGALLYGGKLVVLSLQEAKNPRICLEKIIEHEVTVLSQTPTAFYSLMKISEAEQKIAPSIRYVVFAGEALTPSKLKTWHQNHKDAKLINMYGITEVTVHTSFKEITEKEMSVIASNIGKSIPTAVMYLLDSDRKLVPQGMTGEIYVGGIGVSRGYLNKESLTAERFIPNPFLSGDILYQSGDLARMMPNGDLDYVGRTDHQIQLKGFRIELSEIEFQLGNHEAISDAFVFLKEENEEAFLCAYFLANREVYTEELREYLNNKVPAYMIPSYYMQIEEVPQTHNNKIDVRKLPKPEIQTNSMYIAPSNHVEQEMVRIWEQVLNLKKTGINDNYFVLGGDSLKAISLIFEINNALQTSLTIADLYTYQTIAELSKEVLKINSEETNNSLLVADNELIKFQEDYKKNNEFLDDYEEVYPMNGIEKGMVFYSLKRESDNFHEILYHEQNIYPFPFKNFDIDIFKKVLQLLINKHDSLRKIFDLENFAHIIKKDIVPQVDFIDIRDLALKEKESFIYQKMKEERIKETNLSFTILWRMSIIKIKDDFQFLLFDLHHSLFDGWSLSSFMTELNNLYFKLLDDSTFVPNNLQSTYKDQILGEIMSINKESTVKYWKEELEDYSRLKFEDTGLLHEYKCNKYEIGASFRKELEKTAVKYNTTFKHLCFAAYVYTMKMLTFSDDITVGLITNNRPLITDGEELLGCFLNTVPFRTKFTDEMTWEEYVQHIENKLRILKYHEQMPFYKILDAIGEVSQEGNPVYDTAFNYIDFRVFNQIESNEKIKGSEDVGLEFDNYMNENTLLNFSIFAHNEGFKLVLTYSTSIIDESLLEKIPTYFKNVLQKIVDSDEEKISNASIFSKQEKQKLFVEFNDTAILYTPDRTVLDLFKEQALLNPDRVAVIFEEDELTYKELDSVSNQLSHILIDKGVVNETLVPICVDRSLEMIIGVLGILKAGGAYVPIDIESPQSRIDHILEDTEAAIVLTESKYENHFSLPTLILNDKELFQKRSKQSPDVSIKNHALAYVIYTSGTTGVPKGVKNEHSGIYNRLLWMRDYLEVTKEDVIFQKTTFSFDVSIFELFLPLISGAKLLFAKPNGHKDIDYLQDKIEQKKVTIIHFVPSMLSIFLSNIKRIKCQSLKNVICSGEELKSSTLMNFKAQLPDLQIHNLYGPTEAAIEVTAIDLTLESQVTIGKPIANTQIYIVDKQNNIQPIGVQGELLIGGIQVARGYLKREALNAQKFIDNPFNKDDKYKLYRTGDLSRWLPDGNIEYIGRIDRQVKIRGNRIELGEIEVNLDEIKGVEESFIVVREHLETKQLVAYLKGKELDIESINAQLSQKVPDYMVPQIYIELASFPLKSNGKIDRESLPSPEFKVNQYTAAKGELELKLVAIWQEILGVEKIGVNNDFFKLGGQSLKLMRLVSHYHKEFGVKLNIQDMFTNRTISTHKELIELYQWQNDDNKEENLETETNIF